MGRNAAHFPFLGTEGSASAEDYRYAPEVEPCAILQALADVGRQSLAIQLGVVGRLQVFHEVVVPYMEQPRVSARHPAVLAAVWSEVNVREDTTTGVLAAHRNLLLLRQR